ncbi:DUF2264 domain-containing protein [Cellulomonas fimi]|uniref:Uncharacterized conserved protein UCP014753 n=1 Tax=Cellulomonas fimi (strain ATCC 484 / DSM 20113 / JCM 1341 / CCUG 24087 / LMG 16345 / NBRC 15513 / NCIMB 8980 / NCTC 7547 / NRS-133) TaxID=590998 RepID=F4H0M3_CELFA|nr:DUF2264 domain-containing protein [Cellulomonas fimi]AEE44996.1 Uncharacterized conserved protein UCP014753 [Cellulomonas fimi ATCC 484]NNH08977.1 DUF2264 domain-containing protein [Cellulomonas fimi]VEH27920.1 Uncharacterized protein conserved in bacteria [Cellulomonas fimi]
MTGVGPRTNPPTAVRTREDWAALADRLLLGVRPYRSPGGALVTLPGAPGGYGTAVDGLEGFARTFLLAGFRLAGERGEDPLGLAERYAAGLAAGTDPSSPERWTRPDEHGQAKVEAASLALILDLTRPWIWDRLDDGVQQRVVEYLAPVVGDEDYPRTNWLWFRVVVETFLRSVGGPWSADDVEADLARHESFVHADGWYSDGAGRGFDHYVGWALHLYPVLWARMQGAADLAAHRRDTDVARLDRFLQDAVRLVGADGGPLVQGRSLTYRFAAAAPFWAGALAGVPSTPPGLLRRAASSVVGHFVERGAPGDDDLLTLGWHGPWRPLAQRYSGTGSPYWASKGLLGLALPADHPVWTTPEEPLPVERADQFVAVTAPGWVVSGTVADGVVRVVNHGTDHAEPGADTGDSPLYARLGYSTATAPLLDADAWRSPLDQSVVLLDDAGRATHRTGMTLLGARVERSGTAARPVDVGVAASRAHAHWVDVDPAAEAHGSGLQGVAVPAGVVRTVSLVRGAWEVRCVRVEDLTAERRVVALRCGGWPVAGAAAVGGAHPGAARVVADGLTSTVVALAGDDAGQAVRAGVHEASDASPLGARAAVPWLSVPARPGRWWVVAVGLEGTVRTDGPAPTDGDGPTAGTAPAAGTTPVDGANPGEGATPTADLVADRVVVTWPDGARTVHAL